MPFFNNFFKYNDFNSKLVEGFKKNFHAPKSNNNRTNVFKVNNQVFYTKNDNKQKINKEKYFIKRSVSNKNDKLKQNNSLNKKNIMVKDLKIQISKNKRKPPLTKIE